MVQHCWTHTEISYQCNSSCSAFGFRKGWLRCFCTAKSDRAAKTIDFLRDYKVFSSQFVSREILITLPDKAGPLKIPRLLMLAHLPRCLDDIEQNKSSASVLPGDLQSSCSLMTRTEGSRRAKAFDFGDGVEWCLHMGTEWKQEGRMGHHKGIVWYKHGWGGIHSLVTKGTSPPSNCTLTQFSMSENSLSV